MNFYAAAIFVIALQTGFSEPYGKCGQYPVYAVYVSENEELSLRIFGVKENEYERIKECLFLQSRKLAVENQIVDFGGTGYGFLWKRGHLSFFVNEAARPDGLRNIYLEIAPQQRIFLEDRTLILKGISKNDH